MVVGLSFKSLAPSERCEFGHPELLVLRDFGSDFLYAVGVLKRVCICVKMFL